MASKIDIEAIKKFGGVGGTLLQKAPIGGFFGGVLGTLGSGLKFFSKQEQQADVARAQAIASERSFELEKLRLQSEVAKSSKGFQPLPPVVSGPMKALAPGIPPGVLLVGVGIGAFLLLRR